MKIPFDIKYRPQIESGEYKVETRDGTLARIICWDCKDDYYPILGLIDYSDKEICESFTIYGKNNDYIEVGDCDLFIITPDPEIKKFEELLADCIKESFLIPLNNLTFDDVAQGLAKNWKDKLLTAAILEHDTQLQQAYKNSDNVQYQRGYEKGCKDTNAKLKDLLNETLKAMEK